MRSLFPAPRSQSCHLYMYPTFINEIIELLKHCIRSRYDHCKGKTIKNITDSFTDYLKYHKTSYSIYETLEYRKQNDNMAHGNMFPLFLHSELAKYISVGNYVRIGKVFFYFAIGDSLGFQMVRTFGKFCRGISFEDF